MRSRAAQSISKLGHVRVGVRRRWQLWLLATVCITAAACIALVFVWRELNVMRYRSGTGASWSDCWSQQYWPMPTLIQSIPAIPLSGKLHWQHAAIGPGRRTLIVGATSLCNDALEVQCEDSESLIRWARSNGFGIMTMKCSDNWLVQKLQKESADDMLCSCAAEAEVCVLRRVSQGLMIEVLVWLDGRTVYCVRSQHGGGAL